MAYYCVNNPQFDDLPEGCTHARSNEPIGWRVNDDSETVHTVQKCRGRDMDCKVLPRHAEQWELYWCRQCGDALGRMVEVFEIDRDDVDSKAPSKAPSMSRHSAAALPPRRMLPEVEEAPRRSVPPPPSLSRSPSRHHPIPIVVIDDDEHEVSSSNRFDPHARVATARSKPPAGGEPSAHEASSASGRSDASLAREAALRRQLAEQQAHLDAQQKRINDLERSAASGSRHSGGSGASGSRAREPVVNNFYIGAAPPSPAPAPVLRPRPVVRPVVPQDDLVLYISSTGTAHRKSHCGSGHFDVDTNWPGKTAKDSTFMGKRCGHCY